MRIVTKGQTAGGPDAHISLKFQANKENLAMMLDWNDYRSQLLGTIKEIGATSPEITRGYQGLSHAGAKTGTLDSKTRELIALAVAVTRQCDGCIAVHVDSAKKVGATREEIVEALGVAIAANAGAALVYSARVVDAMAAHEST